MGTGCDTILAQMAADCLDCDMDQIIVHGVDTDVSPYDTGSYASSTTYVTGMAVVKTCEVLKEKILKKGAQYISCPKEEVEFEMRKRFRQANPIILRLLRLLLWQVPQKWKWIWRLEQWS